MGYAHPSYSVWKGMHHRCYISTESRHRTYRLHCTVCPEWHDYHTFKEWYIKHHIKGYHLDKDTLIKGNKVYSPDTCTFISPQANNDVGNRDIRIDNKTGVVGVSKHKHNQSWTVMFKGKYQGSYKTLFDAVCKRKSLEHQYSLTM